MGRSKLWSRRRGDNRQEKFAAQGTPDYAPIQDASHLAGTDMDDLSIPEFDTPASQNTPDPVAELPPAPENTGAATPRVFALTGATGGVGTTSLATQLAHELAVSTARGTSRSNRPNDPHVCLIDLDFEQGACAHHLDLLPSLTLADLMGPADKIDTALTAALTSSHASGISILAAPNSPGANARVNPHTIMAILDAATEIYDYVVIDMPRYTQSWTLAVMAAVDVLGVTCELTIPSLQAGRERLARIALHANGAVNAQVIMSKYERRSFKNTLRLSDAETALGREVLATICLDPDTTREALNCGEPAGVVRADARFVKDVRKLSDTLRAQHVNALSAAA